MSRAAFLDLNGTLVVPIKVDRLSDLAVIPGAAAAIARLCRMGFRCPVVTVQSRIARGAFTESQFREWFARFAERMADKGAFLEGPYVCPHRFRTACSCKKPSTLLYERAAQDCGLDFEGAVVIGDSADDMEAARRLGVVGCVVRIGWAADEEHLALARPKASYVGNDLKEVVDWILTEPAARMPAGGGA